MHIHERCMKASRMLHLGKRKQDQNFSKIADFEGLKIIRKYWYWITWNFLIKSLKEFPKLIYFHTLTGSFRGRHGRLCKRTRFDRKCWSVIYSLAYLILILIIWLLNAKPWECKQIINRKTFTSFHKVYWPDIIYTKWIWVFLLTKWYDFGPSGSLIHSWKDCFKSRSTKMENKTVVSFIVFKKRWNK